MSDVTDEFTTAVAKALPAKVQAKHPEAAVFRNALLEVFSRLGGVHAMTDWAKENQSDFYRLCAKMLPAEFAAIEASKERAVIQISLDFMTPERAQYLQGQPVDPAVIEHQPKLVDPSAPALREVIDAPWKPTEKQERQADLEAAVARVRAEGSDPRLEGP